MARQKEIKLTEISNMSVDIDDSNILDALEIASLMEHPGWATLDKWFDKCREIILEDGKVNATKDLEMTSKIRWAILEGFDRYRALPLQIKQQADLFKAAHSGGTNGEQG